MEKTNEQIAIEELLAQITMLQQRCVDQAIQINQLKIKLAKEEPDVIR